MIASRRQKYVFAKNGAHTLDEEGEEWHSAVASWNDNRNDANHCHKTG